MKNLTKLFTLAILTAGLAACGNTQNPNLASGLNGYNGQAGLLSGQGGCVPVQSGVLTFTGQGIAMNSALIAAGNLPQNSAQPGSYGTVSMGGGGAYGGIQYAEKQSQYGYGSLRLSVSQNGNSSGILTGQIVLSQQVIAALMSSGYTGYSQYPQQQYNNQVCVSSVALYAIHTVVNNNYSPYSYGNQYSQYNQYGSAGMGQINQAQVYLYLNNGQAVGPLTF